MKINRLWFGCFWLMAAMPCLGADVGIVTLLDGKPRLLRGTACAGTDVKGGASAGRGAGKAVTTAERAPATFVAALPRDFMDALPLRTSRFANPREPVQDHEATYPEVQAWLAGPYRVSFMKR